MTKAKPKKAVQEKAPIAQHIVARLRISAFILIAPLAFYLLICLISYDPSDPGWSNSGQNEAIRNMGGLVGAWVADIILILFGLLAYLFPLILLYAGVLIVRERKPDLGSRAEKVILLTGFVVGLLAGTALAHIHFSDVAVALPEGGGGITGQFIGQTMLSALGSTGATLVLLSLFLAGLTLFTGLSWTGLMDRIGGFVIALFGGMGELRERFSQWREGRHARKARVEIRKADSERRKSKPPRKIKTPAKKPERSIRKAREVQMPLFTSIPAGSLPPLSLLDEPPEQKSGYSEETLEALARQVELKLADFKVEAEVVEVVPGPVITRFELLPAPGVKGSQITNLAKDLARGLSVTSVRVVDVIPGKSVIGLEIPNTNREIVYLSQIIQSRAYDDARSPMTLGLGKDISGKPVVANLGKMPHLLVAGTTGSGKSVAVNAMILSILYKATPDQVRMIMIDPKMLELSVYEDIPHLLAPVVTDMKEAANALRWCVAEMERRYRLMAALGVRNLAGFNRKIADAAKAGNTIPDPLFQQPEFAEEPVETPALESIPQIVVVVDEFADMMMIVGKKVEELIARLAQKARASGIHLILATQRPSVDVITGLIKANVPTRIAFQVSSKVDSRTILDQMGAEQLLGHGDMLFLPPGSSTPERVHGAFVDDHEVHAVVKYLKQHAEPNYLEDVLDDSQVMADGVSVGDNGLPDSSGEGDELYDKAVYIVTSSRRASISSVQRQLRIGYNRAARLVEEMEAAGIVSAPEHNGTREVLAPPPPKD